MALDERVTLELRKWNTVFIALRIPHAEYRVGARMPEAVDDPRLSPKMVAQRCPVRSDRRVHSAILPVDAPAASERND